MNIAIADANRLRILGTNGHVLGSGDRRSFARSRHWVSGSIVWSGYGVCRTGSCARSARWCTSSSARPARLSRCPRKYWFGAPPLPARERRRARPR